ncbi:type II secretion system secretin GspD [Novosphingobium sp.]|uniref:type II secretion system secretin GspD n=1 Tax=Novosphingobium sp. TaxID=1874826 RepID=UPI003D0B083F
MTRSTNTIAAIAVMSLSCPGTTAARPPIDIPATPAIADEKDPTSVLDRPVRTTVVPGTAAMPMMPQAAARPPAHGDITINFPNADVRAVASTVLGDLLHKTYTVAQGVTATVTLSTPYPVTKGALLDLFEAALRQSGLALVPVAGGYEIQNVAGARAPIAPEMTGSGSEVITLHFINADEVRKLLDTVLPGVVTASDPAIGMVTISGTTGQRASARDLLHQFDVDWLRNTSFALYIPEKTDARLIVPSLDKLINAPDSPTHGLVRLIAMDQLNGILAISTQRQYLDDVRRWVEILDREGENNERRIFVYRVQNSRAKDLTKTINAAYGGISGADNASADQAGAGQSAGASLPQPGAVPAAPVAAPTRANAAGSGASPAQAKITADDTNNAVIVFGTARQYAIVEDALRKLDITPKQILIEAAITEVTLTDDLAYGVQWNYSNPSGSSQVGYANTVNGVPQAQTFPGLSFFYAQGSISATLTALQQHTNVKVVSAPKLLVLNNQTASLQVGDQVPTQTGSTSNANGTSTSISYADTGIILKITPRVNASGVVQLDVAQEVSGVSGSTGGSTIEGITPTISTRKISTTVEVHDGQVIALGGLFSDTKTVSKNGIPFLSQIPIVGGLFGTHHYKDTRTELIVLLKPHVIATEDDARGITDELARKLHALPRLRSEGGIP